MKQMKHGSSFKGGWMRLDRSKVTSGLTPVRQERQGDKWQLFTPSHRDDGLPLLSATGINNMDHSMKTRGCGLMRCCLHALAYVTLHPDGRYCIFLRCPSSKKVSYIIDRARVTLRAHKGDKFPLRPLKKMMCKWLRQMWHPDAVDWDHLSAF